MAKEIKRQIRTRIAPSPTGMLHVGTARAALFNELFARKQGGEFVLRIEDTDRQRSEKKFEQDVLTGLKWLGLEWDEGPDIGGKYGPYRQSERGEFYRAALQQLIDDERAYQVPHGEAIVFRVSEEEIVFTDLIRGTVKVPTSSWGGDFIVARSMNDPLFHLAVVVDDAAQRISHVIRGEDHLTNTARHILLQRALGLLTPQYAHLPLLLDEKRRKLSKRSGEVSLLAYREMGYLPEALLNYLALLGWNPGDDREYFSYDELVTAFSLTRVQKSGAIFSLMKLNSMNQHYLRHLPPPELQRVAAEYAAQTLHDPLRVSEQALLTEQQRVSTLRELVEDTAFARQAWGADYAPEVLVWRKSTPEATMTYLERLAPVLDAIPDADFTKEKLEAKLLAWIDAEQLGRGDVLWPMRVALTGREHSPGPFEVAAVLGKAETVRRLTWAADRLVELT